MFFTIFFLLHLSSFCCRFCCCCPVYFGWNYSFWWDTWRRDGRAGNGGQCGSPRGAGLADVGLDMNVHAFAKGSTFSVNMAESQRVCKREKEGGRTGRCVCVRMCVCEWRSTERGVNEHKQGRRSSICCFLCNSMFHAFKHGQRLSLCVCVSAFYMRLFIYTHTRTHTRGNHSWHWQRESCRAKAPSGRVYLALTLDIPLNFAFTVHCTKLKAQVEVQSNIN